MECKGNAVLRVKLCYAHFNAPSSVDRRVALQSTVICLTRSLSHLSHSCALLYLISLSIPKCPIDSPYLTQIEHCLREWESGTRLQANLDETTDTPRYRTHMANAVAWECLDKEKTTLVRQHLSGRLMRVSNTSFWPSFLTCFCSESCGPKLRAVETTGSISQATLAQEKEMLAERIFTYDTDEEV